MVKLEELNGGSGLRIPAFVFIDVCPSHLDLKTLVIVSPPFKRSCLGHSSSASIILPSGNRDPSISVSLTSLGGKLETSLYLLIGLHCFSQTSKVTMKKQISKSSDIEN